MRINDVRKTQGNQGEIHNELVQESYFQIKLKHLGKKNKIHTQRPTQPQRLYGESQIIQNFIKIIKI